jgi:hypothetical protein
MLSRTNVSIINHHHVSEMLSASIIRAIIALMMEAVSTSETSVNFYQTRNIPDLQTRRHEKLKSCQQNLFLSRILREINRWLLGQEFKKWEWELGGGGGVIWCVWGFGRVCIMRNLWSEQQPKIVACSFFYTYFLLIYFGLFFIILLGDGNNNVR